MSNIVSMIPPAPQRRGAPESRRVLRLCYGIKCVFCVYTALVSIPSVIRQSTDSPPWRFMNMLPMPPRIRRSASHPDHDEFIPSLRDHTCTRPSVRPRCATLEMKVWVFFTTSSAAAVPSITHIVCPLRARSATWASTLVASGQTTSSKYRRNQSLQMGVDRQGC